MQEESLGVGDGELGSVSGNLFGKYQGGREYFLASRIYFIV